MEFLLHLYTHQFLVFLMVLTRVSGLVVLAPVWGSRAIPMQVRTFLAIGIALIVSPLFWHTPVEDPGNLLQLVVLLTCEFAVGLSLGLAVMIYFSGMELAGQILGQMTGMSLADVASPDFDTSVPVFSQFLHLLMLSIFVITGGHAYLLDALFQIFQRMPPGQTFFSMPLIEALTEITTYSFALGLKLAAPMIVALMLSILIMGLISRTLPQLNILAIGFSVNSIILLSAMLLSLGVLTRMFEGQSLVAIDLIRSAFDSPPP